MPPLITPPRIKAEHHVSKFNGILRDGNNVFNDQIEATGPIKTIKTSNAISIIIFIV
jgi:hypothetical protein